MIKYVNYKINSIYMAFKSIHKNKEHPEQNSPHDDVY